MKKLYFSLSALILFNICSAQKVTWQKDISTGSQDFLSTMTATLDRQVLAGGSSIGLRSGVNTGYDYHVVKLSQRGEVLWDKTFGGTQHDYLTSNLATQEGGFLLSGTSFSNHSGEKTQDNLGGSDVWLVRLDEDGNLLWDKTLGTAYDDEAIAAIQSANAGFFVAGNIAAGNAMQGSKDIFVSKVDRNGRLLKTTFLGGNRLDEVRQMIPTPDGGVALLMYSNSDLTADKFFIPENSEDKSSTIGQAGLSVVKANSEQTASLPGTALWNDETEVSDKKNVVANTTRASSTNPTQKEITIYGKQSKGFGEGDYWLVKLSKDGAIEWQQSYGGTGDDQPQEIVFTEKGYLLTGQSRSKPSGNKTAEQKGISDVWVIAVDELGEKLWEKSYHFGDYDVPMDLQVIRTTDKDHKSTDKGFLIGGYSQAMEQKRSDNEKFWLLYLDPSGNEVWRKYVEGKEKKSEERLVSAQMQSDGSYLLAGTSAETLGTEGWKILKLGDPDVEALIEKQPIRVYPNPVQDYAYVEIGVDFKSAIIQIYDMSGKLIRELQTRERVTKLNTATLPQGMYIIVAQTTDPNQKLNVKIIKR